MAWGTYLAIMAQHLLSHLSLGARLCQWLVLQQLPEGHLALDARTGPAGLAYPLGAHWGKWCRGQCLLTGAARSCGWQQGERRFGGEAEGDTQSQAQAHRDEFSCPEINSEVL